MSIDVVLRIVITPYLVLLALTEAPKLLHLRGRLPAPAVAELLDCPLLLFLLRLLEDVEDELYVVKPYPCPCWVSE